MIQFMYLRIYMNTVESMYLKLRQNTYVLQIFTIQFEWIQLYHPIKSSEKSS